LNPEKAETIIALPDAMKLSAGVSLTREVNGLLGYNAVETRCDIATPSINARQYNGKGKRRRE